MTDGRCQRCYQRAYYREHRAEILSSQKKHRDAGKDFTPFPRKSVAGPKDIQDATTIKRMMWAMKNYHSWE